MTERVSSSSFLSRNVEDSIQMVTSAIFDGKNIIMFGTKMSDHSNVCSLSMENGYAIFEGSYQDAVSQGLDDKCPWVAFASSTDELASYAIEGATFVFVNMCQYMYAKK